MTTSFKSLTFLSLFAGLCLLGRNVSAESAIIGKIGSTEVRASEIKPMIDNLSPADREALLTNPALLNQMVRALLLQRVVLMEAEASGHEKDAEFQEQLKRLKEAAIAESYLQSVTKVPESYPNESELKEAYEERKSSLVVPKTYQVSQIFVALAEDAEKEEIERAKKKVEEIQKKLKEKDADFAQIARAHSEAVQNADQGGEVGWVAESNLQPKIRTALAKMDKGQISDVIQMSDGFYLVKLNDERDSYTASLEQVRPQLEQLLKAERMRFNREAYMSRLAQQNPIMIDELKLPQLLESAGQ